MKLFISFLFLAVLTSCTKSESNFEGGVKESLVSLSPIKSNAPHSDKKEKDVSETDQKIIKTGDITFQTNNLQTTRNAILLATKKLDGYVATESESGYENNQKNYTLNLKIPAKNFDALFEAISSTADHIDSKNINIQDVTTEYIDTKSRLENQKVLEKRYLELLNKASKITDMLAIENKISEIRTEIESDESQFIYMQKQIAYSSITIEFYSKNIVFETGNGFFNKLIKSLSSGWEFIQITFFALISIWPLIVIAILLLWYFRRRLKAKQT